MEEGGEWYAGSQNEIDGPACGYDGISCNGNRFVMLFFKPDISFEILYES